MTTSSATKAFYVFQNGQTVNFDDYKTINKLVRKFPMPKIQFLGSFTRTFETKEMNEVFTGDLMADLAEQAENPFIITTINAGTYNIIEVKTDGVVIGQKYYHREGVMEFCKMTKNSQSTTYHSYWKD
jgi:hypothetical protein